MGFKNVTDKIFWIGADDENLELFENQYPLDEGMSYNSYVIKDEKIVVMDTIDEGVTDKWFENLSECLGNDKPDYIVVSHMEPDHAANLKGFLDKYPDTVVVGNVQTFNMIKQFFGMGIPEDKKLLVKEGDNLSIGSANLTFVMAPMVHWPEVMMTYESESKVVFTADAFGKFGKNGEDVFNTTKEQAEDWACEGRRYYTNIVGKYGPQVQAVLKKMQGLDVEIIAPLHGPVLKSELDYYINKYNIWSTYSPEDIGYTVCYSTIHGNTRKVAEYVASILDEKGIIYELFDLSNCDVAEVVESAFRYDKMLLLGVTYDGGLMPCMQDMFYHFKMKNVQNRKVGLIQNGTWGPLAGKLMKEQLEGLKNMTILDKVITIKSVMTEANKAEIKELIDTMN